MRESLLIVGSDMKYKLALIVMICMLPACTSDEAKQETQPVNLEYVGAWNDGDVHGQGTLYNENGTLE
jgi:hypothetical protein